MSLDKKIGSLKAKYNALEESLAALDRP